MDKNAIKKYAVWARRELISRVSQKALQYGITEKDIVPADAESVNGHLLAAAEKKQRQALVAQVNEKGYEQVMEEVAYTWFNRFSALRFMEVNGYLPSHVRVFTDDENNFKPQILTEAIHLELDGLDMHRVYAFKEANQTEELYKYLLIIQCNALNAILPGMFQKIEDYTELLFPDNLLREGSAVEQMIALIPEDDWKDAVQIIGWLYQYYNTEPKADVFGRASGTKIKKEDIPAATQLFTPDWIVRYMVENSLGRLWLERDKAESGLSDEYMNASYYGWKYYLEEAEQEPEVQKQLAAIREEYKALKPEDIRCIDPCMGSGHILAYMFDVLVQIYEAYGYATREAVASIVENNIYGLDIDERAAQLANFAVMMKARQYDRRFFNRGIQPRIYAIVESNHISSHYVDYFCKSDDKLKSAIDTITLEMHDAKEYGSIITVSQQDFTALYARFDEVRDDINILREGTLAELLPLVQIAETMAQKYDTVVTNPPYMGSDNMNSQLANYVNKHYKDSRADLYAVFIKKCSILLKQNGYQAMITQHSWMFLSTFTKFRSSIINSCTFINMCHLGTRAFEEIGGEVVQTVSWVMRKSVLDYRACYIRLVEPSTQVGKEELFLSYDNRYFKKQNSFKDIPNIPVAYWISPKIEKIFADGEKITDFVTSRDGLTTGKNELFIKYFWEIPFTEIQFGSKNADEFWKSKKKYAPLIKGGQYRKWYGNNWFVITYDTTHHQILSQRGNKLPSQDSYFKPYITWNRISTRTAFRYCETGYLFESASLVSFSTNQNNLFYALSFANTSLASSEMQLINPTTNMLTGYVDELRIPKVSCRIRCEELAESCIKDAKADWDSFETSWDFTTHPLIKYKIMGGFENALNGNIDQTFRWWETNTLRQFNKLKANEEELNRIFIDIYGLQDELTPEVADKDVTIRKADLVRDVKSFISYAVGCMFGRYSLDVNGLVFAGGEWDDSKYTSFPADKDNIIPICDDEYFEDDIVGRFVKFIEVVYGKGTLQENLQFIADALGGKGQLKEVIRNYFINDFYKDHCKTYQKRPIYWLFDSGKKNGFKALIYMHRYQPDTIARMRTDYVHEQQARYRTAIADLEQRINGASTGERVKLNKQLIKLQEQAAEIQGYEEKIHHLADQMIPIDLDDGVKHNYEIFKDVLAKIK